MTVISAPARSGLLPRIGRAAFSGRFKKTKIFLAVSSFIGLVHGTVNVLTHDPIRLNVQATCGASKCVLDIRGENANFAQEPPRIEVESGSGLRVLKTVVLGKERARAEISIEQANPGKWDVNVAGFDYTDALTLR